MNPIFLDEDRTIALDSSVLVGAGLIPGQGFPAPLPKHTIPVFDNGEEIFLFFFGQEMVPWYQGWDP